VDGAKQTEKSADKDAEVVAEVGAPNLSSFRNAQLRGVASIEFVAVAEGRLVDVSGGPALGHTSTNVGTGVMTIRIAPGLSPTEQSITLYHEVIEAVSLQAESPPALVLDLSEEEIDLLAKLAHEEYGTTKVANLNKLLAELGF
jgi:hypothetical protein